MEGDHGHDVVAGVSVHDLFTLRLGTFVGYDDVAAILGVDAGHDFSEHHPVGTGILQLVVADVVMNHLVKNRVFHLLFGQVHPSADAQHEVVFLHSPVLSRPFFIDARPQKCLRMAQSDRGHR